MKSSYLLTVFIVSFGAALGAGYFMGMNHERHRVGTVQAIEKPSTVASSAVDNATDASKSDVASAASAAAEQAQTYIVKKGQTLYSIGKEIGVSWPALAGINNLTETSVLKEGQVLKIPTANEAQTSQAREFKVATSDDEKQNLQAAQDYAKAGTGQLAYRLVPAQVVQRSPLLSRFGFTTNDLYIEKSKDYTKGEAAVEVTHEGKLYTVYLNQPLDKGEKGVWTPVRVTY